LIFMDIASLTAFLSPFLPFLLDLGKKAAEKATESAAGKFGETAWKKAEGIWDKLQPEVNATPDVKAAIEQVAAKPDSAARQAVLREELEALFKAQPQLLSAIAKIMQDDNGESAPRIQIQQNISGGVVFTIADTKIDNLAGTGNFYAQGARPQSERIESSLVTSAAEGRSIKTILVLSAQPKGVDPLRLEEEVRELRRGLERSRHRDKFRIEQRSALTAQDLRRALIDCQPQIVHFSGHGAGEPGLVFENAVGELQLVSGAAIAQLFDVFADVIECVVLNACYSEVQATVIAQYVPHVIGMKQAIGDRAAIEFSIGFYDGLLGGRSIRDAYKLGCNAIQMAGIPEDLTPTLVG
jgi:CHAT domain